MLPLRKIICPTDFSAPSYTALAIAGELALRDGAEVILLHVVAAVPIAAVASSAPASSAASVPGIFDVEVYRQNLRRAARESLQEVAAEWLDADVRMSLLVGEGDAAEQIVAESEKQGADLIVIATHGRTGWRRFLSGSVTEKVVRLAALPVLTVQAPRGDQA